jgi:hypothetical protein
VGKVQKLKPALLMDMANFFDFVTFEEKSSCASHTLFIKDIFSAELDNI